VIMGATLHAHVRGGLPRGKHDPLGLAVRVQSGGKDSDLFR
jgi:hypothetical protein